MARETLCDEAVTSVKRLDELLTSGKRVVAMLHNDGPSWRQIVDGLRQQHPLLDYLDRKDVTVVSVDVNKAPGIAQQLGYLPNQHVIAFDPGKEKEAQSGRFERGEQKGQYVRFAPGSNLQAELVSWYGRIEDKG